MESEIVAFFVAHGMPAWLCPDALTFVGVAGFGGGYLVMRAARQAGVPLHEEARTILLAFIASWLGGHIFEAAWKFPQVLATRSLDPIRDGGADMFAALISGSAVPAAYLSFRRMPVAPYLDRSIWLWGLTIACTRMGCFMNGCDFGSATSSFVGMRFPPGTPAAHAHEALGWVRPGASSLPLHPTQLYEAALGLGTALVAWYVIRPRVSAGRTFLIWFGMYAAGRFLVEFLRADASRSFVRGFTNGQVACVGLLTVLALVGLILRRGALVDESPNVSTVRIEPESKASVASI